MEFKPQIGFQDRHTLTTTTFNIKSLYLPLSYRRDNIIGDKYIILQDKLVESKNYGLIRDDYVGYYAFYLSRNRKNNFRDFFVFGLRFIKYNSKIDEKYYYPELFYARVKRCTI